MGPRESLASGQRTALALPDESNLLRLAKVHLVRGIREGRSEEATNDVRHFARLHFTTEYLIGPAMGVLVLTMEHQVTGRGFDERHTEALRSRLLALTPANNPLITGHLPARTTARFLRCIAMTEAAFAGRAVTLDDTDCSFTDARWELRHPFRHSDVEPIAALSTVGRIGGRIAHTLAPSLGAWPSLQPEFVVRLMSGEP